MSFGLDIVTLDVDGNEHWISVVDGHTYNLAPMWRKALPSIGSTSDLHGRTCRDMLPELEAGLHDAITNADAYRELNPSNGWGDYEGFVKVFATMAILARKYQSGEIRWNG